MKNSILTLALLMCIFMSIGCLASSQGDLWHEWPDERVFAYFDGIPDIVSLASDLVNKGYYWFSDGTLIL